MGKDTEASVFIIESLTFDDEKDGQFEGRVLRDILAFSNTPSEYFYIRTRSELSAVLERFEDSKHRYLHISCHGNAREIGLTLDSLTYEEFGIEIDGLLDGKRLFFSACQVVNRDLAKAILPESNCFSLIGPSKSINFDDAVLMWASFYHLMFRDIEEEGMKGEKIRWALRRLQKAFDRKFSYYKPESSPEGFVEVNISKK